VAFLFGWSPRAARGQTSATQAEARARFDKGIQLFNDGDNAGALAEFRRAYELIPNPLVLYNIGLVYVAMGRPVEAVATLDQVLANPGPVAADKLSRAKATREQQMQRIVLLSIVTNVAATIEVDGVPAGQTPLAAPIQVTGGLHVVGALASGYLPSRKEITAAGGTKQDVTLTLAPAQAPMAHATLRTHLPGANVFVDGQASGKTPLVESLTLSPGHHTIELRREGYRTARQDLQLGDGATADLELEPEEDRATIAGLGGVLAIEASEPKVVVTVDAISRGVYAGGLSLAPGEHHLLLERAGFEPKEVDAMVYAHKTSSVRVVLDPTPATRAEYEHGRWVHQTSGAIVGGAGILLIGAAVPFIAWNAGRVSSLMGPYNHALAVKQAGQPPCNLSAGADFNACNTYVDNAYNPLRSAENLTPFGYIGLGVGAAATVTGLVVFFTAGSASRFTHPAPAAATAGRSCSVSPWGDPHGGGLGASVRF